MKRSHQFALVLISISAIVIFTSKNALTKSNGSPFGNTGSPGDGLNNTCAKAGCHVGNVNAFPGSVSIDASNIPSSGYVPGGKYTLVVTVIENGRNIFGFQLTTEDESNNKIGSYISTPGVRLEFTNWVTHSLISSSGVWNVDWTAPLGSKDVTFFVAGNAANGDGSTLGDHIYTNSTTISRDILASVRKYNDQSAIEIFNISGDKSLIVKSKWDANFSIYSIHGHHLKSFNVAQGRTKIDLINLKSGPYIIHEEKSNYFNRIVIN